MAQLINRIYVGDIIMSRQCEICGKGTTVGNNVSHSNIKTKKKVFANLQSVKITLNGTVKHARVCTRCIRSGKIQKA